MLGFPIRTSADRGLVDGSPQLFAVTHVLHRFLAPRHPPLALISLERTSYLFEISLKMLVLALQFSRSYRTAERAQAQRARAARRCGMREQLPQNGREDGGRRHAEQREGPNPCDLWSLWRQPTSAPTGVSRTGWNKCPSAVERHSLERR